MGMHVADIPNKLSVAAPMIKLAKKFTETLMAMPAWRVSKVWISEGTCIVQYSWQVKCCKLDPDQARPCTAAVCKVSAGWVGPGTYQPAQRPPGEREAGDKDAEQGQQALAGRCAHVAVVEAGGKHTGRGDLGKEHDDARKVEQALAAEPARMCISTERCACPCSRKGVLSQGMQAWLGGACIGVRLALLVH